MTSSGTWLGDVVRALAATGTSDPGTVRAVAELLGIERSVGRVEARPPKAPGTDQAPQLSSRTAQPMVRDPEIPAALPTVPATVPPAVGEGPQMLTPVARASRPPVVWTASSLPTATHTGRPPLRQPLLAPRSASAIVQAAVSRWESDGDVDIPRAVGRLARGLPLTSLPRHLAPTLRFGVQVLVDRGLGMQPFHRDQDELVARIRKTVGQDTTDIRYFEDSPLNGTGPGDHWARHPYALPSPGTRVLILTDLGLGGPPRPQQAGRPEWECFLDQLTRAHCAPVVLLPYPRRRWPSWAEDCARLVPWDRGTTVGWVRMHNA